MEKKLKLYVIGWGRHGKDTVGEYLCARLGLKNTSSSLFMVGKCVRKYLEGRGIHYGSDKECYNDRHNWRTEWKTAIKEYNKRKGDLATLTRELFEEYDIYQGIRSREEFMEARYQGLGDLAIWVDASRRVRLHDPTCTIMPEDCDIIIDNNGSEKALLSKLDALVNVL